MARRSAEDAQRRLVRAVRTVTPEELVDLFLVGDWDVRGAAFSAFQSRPADALAQGVLLASSPDPKRRIRGCQLIALDARSRVPDEVLPALLHDPEPEVVGAAVHAFEVLQVVRSSNEFGDRVRADPSTSTYPWPEPLPAHVDLAVLGPIVRHAEVWPRMLLAMALWMCGDDDATRVLAELAKDEDEDVRAAALHSMGWKRYAGGVTQDVLDALWDAVRGSFPRDRVEAVTSLVKLDQPGAHEAFIEQLRSAVATDSARRTIHPMAELLHDPLSAFLPDELREEAYRRWAKSLVGKGTPRARTATKHDRGAPGD